tara:strand:- start:192 stop:392 length:201 start_codon:yes stop_codon:yes gene_type:complete
MLKIQDGMADLNMSISAVQSLVATDLDVPFSEFSVACQMLEMWEVPSQVTEEVKGIRLWSWIFAHP